ncbi:MAG: GAF domain-containing protein [Longicatena sp.]|nr:GAF domain-containing protein [Longicatena sp.]
MKQYYQEMNQVLKALLAGEYDMIANLSNAAALLYQYLPDINWAGFYLWKNNELVLGPFQGKVACMHIPYGKGVCGTCIKELKTQRVENVHKFPDHIACDSASNSEIVIPMIIKDQIIGVLDIDSPIFSRFNEVDEAYLTEFVHILTSSFSIQ